MYLLGTYQVCRRQQQGFPCVRRNLRRPIQVTQIRRGKRYWRCPSTMPIIFRRRGVLPICHRKNARNAASTPFCILGATQIPFAARLVALLDQGHGLLDRFLITFPKCLRPTPAQTSQALEALKENGLTNCDDIFIEIARLHTSRSTYTLTQEAADTLNGLNEEFITEVNEAIMDPEGRTPPKTKKMDVILRVAAALHIFNHVTSDLLAHREPTPPADAIEKSTLLKAIDYVTWAESQKEIFVEVTIFYRFYLNSSDCL